MKWPDAATRTTRALRFEEAHAPAVDHKMNPDFRLQQSRTIWQGVSNRMDMFPFAFHLTGSKSINLNFDNIQWFTVKWRLHDCSVSAQVGQIREGLRR